jgi:hypothetical protein
VTHLADDVLAARLAEAPLEARLVAYADKRAGQRLESMDERFASWRRRYPTGPGEHVRPRAGGGPSGTGWGEDTAALVGARARELEREVCALANVTPADVARLRWSRHALREAQRDRAVRDGAKFDAGDVTATGTRAAAGAAR